MLGELRQTSFYEDSLELLDIIEKGNITTLFQPIISLRDGSVIGYEALTRGPVNSQLHNPGLLFEAAKIHNKTFQLELLCNVKAIERATNLSNDKFLFINIDPLVFRTDTYKNKITKEVFQNQKLTPNRIIFEITERTAIDDFKDFRKTIDYYFDKGYNIAIDDIGSGYSGLKMLSGTKPNYIKMDMDLIRNINNNAFNKSLIECFVKLAESNNMKIIAEGIETEEELTTLIDLGVHAGQGYLINKPSTTFLETPCSIKDLIIDHNQLINGSSQLFISNYVGEIIEFDEAFESTTCCNEVKEYLHSGEKSGVCIVNNGTPVGLVMKHSLDSALATQYGLAVFPKRPISLVMDTNALVVDYYTPVREVSKMAMSRRTKNIYDYIIVTKNNKYSGIVSIQSLLNFTTELEYNYARQLNPLTGLPGNHIIETTLLDYINFNRNCCILYFDLDNFKVYNDTYGFESGDKILKFIADLIQIQTKELFPSRSFVGHIGGDDFICIIEADRDSSISLCEKIISKFDKYVINFFNEKDRKYGYIEAIDRKGDKDIFPLTSISIAGISGDLGRFSSPEDIGLSVATLKKECKKVKGSCYLVQVSA